MSTEPAERPAPAGPPRWWGPGQKVVVVAVAVYAISFVPPAVATNDHVTVPGAIAFVMGPFAVFLLCPVWLANPAFWVGAVLAALRQWNLAAGFGAAAVVLAASVVVVYDPAANPVPHSCTGLNSVDKTRVTHLSVGYYTWVASFACLTASSLLAGRLARRGPPDPPPPAEDRRSPGRIAGRAAGPDDRAGRFSEGLQTDAFVP